MQIKAWLRNFTVPLLAGLLTQGILQNPFPPSPSAHLAGKKKRGVFETEIFRRKIDSLGWGELKQHFSGPQLKELTLLM